MPPDNTAKEREIEISMDARKDFFRAFLNFCDLPNQEAPPIYFRWVCASIIGAMMGRQVYLPFGASKIYPNQYMLLMGPPATKKGTAMKWGSRLLKKTGYSRWAPDKCSKEQFIKSMKCFDDDSPEGIAELEALVVDAPAESYIFAEEFVDFIGQNDTMFMVMLTKLWDNMDQYEHQKITGKDVVVSKPTVNLIGASTADTFALSFPVESLGTGFMSRILLIYAEPIGKRISWPAVPDPLQEEMLVSWLKEMRSIKGEMDLTVEAKKLVGDIYQNMIFIDDERFQYYMERRHQHLLKLSMVLAISDVRKVIATKDVIRANTMLVSAERRMSKALGEYGASKYSTAAGRILQFLSKQVMPMNAGAIWKVVDKDLKNQIELGEVLNNLKLSEKIQWIRVRGKEGYMTRHLEVKEWKPEFVDWSWLTPQEM